MTGLPDDLREALAKALHSWMCCDDWEDIAHEKNVAPDYRDAADAIAPIVAEQIATARAEGITEGERRGFRRGIEWAGDVVHSEARWQWESDFRGAPCSQVVARRMTVTEGAIRAALAADTGGES